MSAVMETISVSSLNRYVKELLETDEVLSQIWVEGELSSVKAHYSSGHIYFKIIDKTASVKCVMFRSYAQRLRFAPQDGMKVILNCQVSLYERDGDFQLYVRDIIPKGSGERQTELDKLKDKLEKEGLFAAERKRSLPDKVNKVVIITSSSGAAIHDIESVAARRDPFAELYLVPVNVQGALAVAAIKDAIDYVNRYVDADVCIIARGGGSRDDLWIFNDESLVRKAASLKMPFISAIGHEIDVSVIDLIADIRAATPTSAAEIALKDRFAQLDVIANQLITAKGHLAKRLSAQKDILDGLALELEQTVAFAISYRNSSLSHLERLLAAYSPFNKLGKGYGYITTEGRRVSSVSEINTGDKLLIKLNDGTLRVTVTEVCKYE